MRRLLLVASAVIAMAAVPACALTVTVDWTGAGDYLTLPQGMAHAGPADTVLVAPGVYTVGGAGWPIVLTANSASIVGRDGAEVTILQGTGTETAFKINAGVYNARRYMKGLTFRSIAHILSKPGEDDGGPLAFTDNIVEYCDGLDATSAGVGAVVARNIFRYNTGGVRLYHNSGIVEYNEICHGSTGLVMHCCEDPALRYNHIHHNTGTGIHTSFHCNVQNNLIEDNAGSGVQLYSGGLIQWNTIRRNGIGISVVSWPATATVRYNDLCDNTTYNIWLPVREPYPWQLNARQNWWGTTDPGAIAQGIWDCNDNPEIAGCVVFEPWCVAPQCGPSATRPSSWGAIKGLYR